MWSKGYGLGIADRVYLSSELSNENSKHYSNGKSSYLTNDAVPGGGPLPKCRLFRTSYWAAQHLLLWAVFAALVACDKTQGTVATVEH